jgi:hypothetical protein
MSDLAVFLNRVASLLFSVIDWAAGLSVGFAALFPCKPLSVGVRVTCKTMSTTLGYKHLSLDCVDV